VETEEKEETRPTRRRTWLPRIFAVVVLLAAGVFALVRLEVIGGPSPEERADTVRADLTDRMRSTLEQMPMSGHAGHGGTDAEGRPVCEARVYGYQPADAKTADEVDTVYGFHFCAVVQPKGTWDFATKFVAPLVMKLGTNPPTTQMAAATETVSYRDSVKKLMPPEYHTVALEGALEPGGMDKLRRRYEAAVAES
jgi:hypothetical protein